jgi:cytochrome c biogenesis protein CcmG/thiol:disulfide interchange protein DsbE
VPCRDEFPLFREKLAAHAGDGLVIVGVLMDDPPEPARAFIEEFGADQFGDDWVTVDDPDRRIRDAYRVAARPTTFFIDPGGVLRSLQLGPVRDADFERQFALIAR